MDTIKKFTNDLGSRLKALIGFGDVFQANEITANIMSGSIMVIMTIILLLCLGLNEIGIFTADKGLMRLAVVLCLIVEAPIVTINQYKRGEAPWLKMALLSDLTIECAIMAAILGHNVTLIMAIPVILSIRYYDEKLSANVAAASSILFLVACIFSANVGILNLNMVKLEPGTELVITDNLRNAVVAAGIDYKSYMWSLLQNEYAPRFLIYSVLAIMSCRIAKRGRELILMQNSVSRKAERVNTELELATQIQIGMLPCIFPAFPQHDKLDIYAMNRPAKEVGGDFYDYFNIDEDHVAVVMADVSGKGVGAALFMTISKIVIKNNLQAGMSPADAMTKANEQLCENNKAGLFVTAWAGVYEVSTGKLTFVNAGHNPPVVRRNNGECEYFNQRNGIVLAGMDSFVYSQSEVHIGHNDALLLYTDGVTEATNSVNELYGEARLIDFFNKGDGRVKSDSTKETIEKLVADVDKFVGDAEQFDDITILGMRVL